MSSPELALCLAACCLLGASIFPATTPGLLQGILVESCHVTIGDGLRAPLGSALLELKVGSCTPHEPV